MTDYGGTGKSLSEIESMPAHQGDSLLMRRLYEVKGQLEELSRVAEELDRLLLSRVTVRGGDRTSDGTYEYRIRETVTQWGFDLEAIAELQNHIAPDEFDNAVVPVPEQVIPATRKPNKAKLNLLAKRGGEIRRIIESASAPKAVSLKTEITRVRR